MARVPCKVSLPCSTLFSEQAEESVTFPEANGRPFTRVLAFSQETGFPRVGLKRGMWLSWGWGLRVSPSACTQSLGLEENRHHPLPPATNGSCSDRVILLFEKGAEKTLYLGVAFYRLSLTECLLCANNLIHHLF